MRTRQLIAHAKLICCPSDKADQRTNFFSLDSDVQHIFFLRSKNKPFLFLSPSISFAFEREDVAQRNLFSSYQHATEHVSEANELSRSLETHLTTSLTQQETRGWVNSPSFISSLALWVSCGPRNGRKSVCLLDFVVTGARSYQHRSMVMRSLFWNEIPDPHRSER